MSVCCWLLQFAVLVRCLLAVCCILTYADTVQNAYVLFDDCPLCSVSGDSSLNSVQFSSACPWLLTIEFPYFSGSLCVVW